MLTLRLLKINDVATMKYVGMRQLKNRLARYLREVEAGNSLTVTVRNRPVAKVIPFAARGDKEEESLSLLVERGLLRPSTRKPRPPKRALKVRNVRIADAVLKDRGAVL
jgi:prevent-host-death family protein